MPQLRVLLSFAGASARALEETATAVIAKFFGNAAFPVIPVPQVELQAALDGFRLSSAAAEQGGPQQTADKVNKRATLVQLLRVVATEVQARHGNNLEVLLSSGFQAVSTSKTSIPLDIPDVKKILNLDAGQLKILLTAAVRNARGYVVTVAFVEANGSVGPWQDGVVFSSTRNMILTGLNSGGLYQLRLRAVGGSTGYSLWSNTVVHRVG